MDEIKKSLRLWCEPARVYELRVPKTKRRGVISGYYDDSDALARTAEVLSDDDDNPAVYLTLNPVLPDLLARCANETKDRCDSLTKDHEIHRRRNLLIDCDPVRPAGISSSDAEHDSAIEKSGKINAYLTGEGFPPAILADSGNGGHNICRIDLPNDSESADLVKRFLQSLAIRFDDDKVSVDTSVWNASRICKVYGTMTRKGSNIPARPWRRAKMLSAPETMRVVPPELFRVIADQVPTTSAPKKDTGNKSDSKDTNTTKTANANTKKARTGPPGNYTPGRVEEMMAGRGLNHKPAVPYEGGTKWELPKCPWSDGHSTGDGGAAVFLRDGFVGFKCQHASCSHRHASDLFPGVNGGRKSPPDGIVVNNRQLRAVTADAIDALDAENDPPTLFRRGGGLVRLRGGRGETVNLDRMRNLLAGAADWCKSTKDGTTAVFPPEDVARNVLATDELPFPELSGVIHAPVFTPTGLLSSSGYDPATGLYLDTTLTTAPTPADPTADEVDAARNLVLDILHDFPFRSDADRAHAVALLLLPFVRPLVDGPTPIHLIDAPSEGTGKGLLVEVFAALATGKEARSTGEPRTSEEWGKVVTSALMTAPSYIFFDNISRPLDSPILASATTARTFADRVLGRSEMVELAVNNVWIGTGNNVHASREIARRIVHIRLDAGVENPNLRTGFRHPDLIRFVGERRGDLVRSCLTLIQSWAAAGSPRSGKTLGSYESWAAVMGGILDRVGIPGFLDNQKDTMSSVNTSDAENRNMVEVWWTIFGDRAVTASELLHELEGAGMVLSCLESARSERGRPIKLGFKLGNLLHRVFDGKRIETGINPARRRQNSACYRLVELPDPSPARPPDGTGSVNDEVARPQPESAFRGDARPGMPEDATSGTTSGNFGHQLRAYLSCSSSTTCEHLPEVPEVKTPLEKEKIRDTVSRAENGDAPQLPPTSGTSGKSPQVVYDEQLKYARSCARSMPEVPTWGNFGHVGTVQPQENDPEEIMTAQPDKEARRHSRNMRVEFGDGWVVQPEPVDPSSWRVGRVVGGIARWSGAAGTRSWAMTELRKRVPIPDRRREWESEYLRDHAEVRGGTTLLSDDEWDAEVASMTPWI